MTVHDVEKGTIMYDNLGVSTYYFIKSPILSNVVSMKV